MDKMLYVAMTGASQNARAQQAHANNLANISTSGFHRDFEQARSMQVFGDTFPARVYAMSERPGTDFSSGTLQETGRDLDVAVEGDGWIAVQAPDGSEAYARTGSLNIDTLGMLRTGDGLPVLGNAGPIAVPPEQQIEVGEDGTISIRAMGEGPRVMAEVDRIKLVNPDFKNMTKGLDGSIHTKDGKSYTKQSTGREFIWDFEEEARRIRDVVPVLPISAQRFESIIATCRDLDREARADALVRLSLPQ